FDAVADSFAYVTSACDLDLHTMYMTKQMGTTDHYHCMFSFFNDTATNEIYTRKIVGSVRCV
ncbi:hypothetical protein, partial [Klebsiella pneumoniae]|uniref:hypothetical protein n=1 Tax=Klebsiella pneumoniae TaxID=573 RepID=UPI0019556FE1